MAAPSSPVGMGRMVVTFHRAVDLRKAEILGQNPAVHFNLNNSNEVIKTPPCHHGNHTPVWNFPHVFDLKGQEHTLEIEVRHIGMLGDDFIGKTTVPLMTLATRPGENPYRLVYGYPDEKPAGDIIISSTWEPAHQISAMGAVAQQAPPQPVYQAPPQPVYQAPPQPVYQAPPQPVYQAPPQPVYQAPPQPVYQAPPQPVYQAPPQPVAQQSFFQEVAAIVSEIALVDRVSSGQVHRLAFRAPNGYWLHAGEHHKAHFSGREVNHLSTWHVIHHEGRVALRSAHGKFLAAYGDGRVAADRDEHLHNERFRIEELGGGHVALRTHHGTYLGADGEGPIVQRSELGHHERFYLQVID